MPAGARDFSFLHTAQTDSGAHPASYTRRQGGEADHLFPFSVEVKNGGTVPPLSHTSSLRSA
jgi:hypothetical protein